MVLLCALPACVLLTSLPASLSLYLLQEDVHRVYAPGKIYFIKRLDKHLGRAKYGNGEHRCKLCQSDDAVPACEEHHHQDANGNKDATASASADTSKQQGAAAAPAAPASSARYELIEADQQQRFQRIVLRETCLVDHLTSGYMEGLKYALQQAKK